MAIPGIITQGLRPSVSSVVASLSRTPQLTIGGWMPSPRKLNAPSARISSGMVMVRITITWLSTFGRI
jgi:hypothetical protein